MPCWLETVEGVSFHALKGKEEEEVEEGRLSIEDSSVSSSKLRGEEEDQEDHEDSGQRHR